MHKITLEIYIQNNWQEAATIEFKDISLGFKSPTKLSYQMSFIKDFGFNQVGLKALGENYPTKPAPKNLNRYPSFLLDIMPAGNAKKAWLKLLKLDKNNPHSEFILLETGGFNAIGNIRVKRNQETPKSQSSGFNLTTVANREKNFIKHLEEFGVPYYGGNSVGGESPKFLLAEDCDGYFHSDLAISDPNIKKNWIVKYPADTTKNEKKILHNEFLYYEIAKWFGLRVGQDLKFQDDALFIPRFDREKDGENLLRFGVESMASLLEADYGDIYSQDKIFETIIKHSNNKTEDIKEFIRRDLLGLLLGDTDNHIRNTSLLKTPDNTIKLSPLYDFAPMFLRPGHIKRSSEWDNISDWEEVDIFKIIETISPITEKIDKELDLIFWYEFYKNYLPQIKNLLKKMEELKIDPEIIEKRTESIQFIIKSIEELP